MLIFFDGPQRIHFSGWQIHRNAMKPKISLTSVIKNRQLQQVNKMIIRQNQTVAQEIRKVISGTVNTV